MFEMVSGDRQKAVLRLNASHPIYAIHFPGNPITPGVCIVQLLGELLERHTAHTLELSKIVNLKFVHPLSPTDTPLLTIDFSSVATEGDTVHAKGTIEANGQVATKFSLIFRCKE